MIKSVGWFCSAVREHTSWSPCTRNEEINQITTDSSMKTKSCQPHAVINRLQSSIRLLLSCHHNISDSRKRKKKMAWRRKRNNQVNGCKMKSNTIWFIFFVLIRFLTSFYNSTKQHSSIFSFLTNSCITTTIQRHRQAGI